MDPLPNCFERIKSSPEHCKLFCWPSFEQFKFVHWVSREHFGWNFLWTTAWPSCSNFFNQHIVPQFQTFPPCCPQELNLSRTGLPTIAAKSGQRLARLFPKSDSWVKLGNFEKIPGLRTEILLLERPNFNVVCSASPENASLWILKIWLKSNRSSLHDVRLAKIFEGISLREFLWRLKMIKSTRPLKAPNSRKEILLSLR